MGKPRKQFWDERSRKIAKRKKARKRYHQISSVTSKEELISNKKNDVIFNKTFKVPETFSFIQNMDETIAFFSNIYKQLNTSALNSKFLIDSIKVNFVTTDVLMYLIALMRNFKTCRLRMYSFYGNYPKELEAQQVYIESGFLKFVKSKSKSLPENSEKMAIISGKRNDAVSAGRICQFVCDKFKVGKGYTKDLYDTLIEMMSNVFYHAYNEERDIMIPEWYMYAEYKDNKIDFVFLDTGVGIARTVRKHSLYEKVISKIGVASEARLIKSALDGDFRTQTGERNHGKGLPHIAKFAHDDKVDCFHILSGKGYCLYVAGQHGFLTKELKDRINGTIYCFTFKKVEVS